MTSGLVSLFQPCERSALNERKHSHEQKSARRTVGGATRRASPTVFLFSMFLIVQNCWSTGPTIRFGIFVQASVFMRSALNTPTYEKTDMPCFHSLYSELKITITQHVLLVVHNRFLFFFRSRVGHLRSHVMSVSCSSHKATIQSYIFFLIDILLSCGFQSRGRNKITLRAVVFQ